MSGSLTVAEFRTKIDDAQVPCQICGHREHSLIRHLQEKHGMSMGQYRNRFGAQALVTSPIVAEMLRGFERKPKQTDRFEQFLPAFQKASAVEIFNDTAVKAVLRPCPPELAHLVPKVDDKFQFDVDAAKNISFCLVSGKNGFLEGPTGCGKTAVVTQVHAKLGMPIKRTNMNGDTTVANFIGSKQADPTKGTYFKYGNLPLAMKGGYTLLIDEIDYMPPNIAAVLNPVLENDHTLYLPETDETIVAAEGFRVIATGNTGGKGDTTGVYTGTEILNTALLDRFAVKMKVGYLPMNIEVAMLHDRFPKKDRGVLQKYVKIANEVRNAFANGSLPITLSTRKLIDLCEMETALSQKDAFNNAILNWLDDDNRKVVVSIMDRSSIKL